MSRAYLEGERQNTPLIAREWLTPDAVTGLIALSGGWEGDVHLSQEERAHPGSPLEDLATLFRGIFWSCNDNPSWCEKAIDSIFQGYGEPLISLPFSLFVLDKVCAEIAGLASPPEGSGSDPVEFLVWFRGAFMANLHQMEQSAFHRM